MNESSINPVAVATAFKKLVSSEFTNFRNAIPTLSEKKVAELLFQKFGEICTEYNFVDDYQNEIGPDDYCSAEVNYSEGSNACSQDFIKPPKFVSIKQKAKILDMIKKNPKWKFETIRSKYKCIKDYKYKSRWREQITGGGTKQEIAYEISRYVLKMFHEARAEYKPVHDSNIRRWAMQRATDFPSFRKTFVASKAWIQRFKKAHRITSRKVQRLVSVREVSNEKEILKNAETFRTTILNLQDEYELANIWNSDQIGFQYEYSSPRTLTYRNEKFTFGSAFSPKNRVTHSYTVQYIISANGEIIGDVYLCLQEPSGKLSDTVQNKIFPAPNVCVTCSVSGKLTTGHVKFFVKHVIAPEIDGRDKILYTVDSWGGHTDLCLYEDLGADGKDFHVKIIPKHCTPYVQPLDVYFNQQLKYLVKKIYAQANLKNININSRNDIIKMQSLAHFTLKSPKFKEMIKYCFHKAGLVNGERSYFKNVKEVCFTFNSGSCSKCENEALICCSWCEATLCFDHFFQDYHAFECEAGPHFK